MSKSNQAGKANPYLEADFQCIISTLSSPQPRQTRELFTESLRNIDASLYALAVFFLRGMRDRRHRSDFARNAVQAWYVNMLGTGFNSYRRKGSGRRFTPYAIRSLKNICMSALRGIAPPQPDFFDPPSDRNDPAKAAELHELHADCHYAMQTLPSHLQECLRLTYLEGLSGREVAAQMGTTPNTIAIWNHRARKRLGAKLRRLGHGPA